MSYHGLAPVVVTPGTTGTYVDIDLTGVVPATATVAILRITNVNASDQAWSVRKKGSTDDYYQEINQQGIAPYPAQTWDFVGLDANRKFQAKIERADVAIEVTGYFEGEAVGFTNATEITLSLTGTYEEVDLAPLIGSDPAVAAMLLFYPSSTNVFARPAGTAQLGALNPDNRHVMLCGLEDRRLEIFRSAAAQRCFLLGYLKDGFQYLEPQGDVTPGTTATWTDMALPAGALGASIWIRSGPSVSTGQTIWGARKDGSGLNWLGTFNGWLSYAVVEAAAETIETYTDVDDLGEKARISLLGYFKATETVVAVTGVDATGAIGTVGATDGTLVLVSGVAAAGGVGTVGFSIVNPTGVAAAAAVGQVKVIATGDADDEEVLVILKTYDEDLPLTLPGLPGPFGSGPFGGVFTFDTTGGEVPVYLSQSGFTSAPADNPASTHFEGRLAGSFSIASRLFDGDRPRGRSQASFGNITVNNDGKGWLDPVLARGIDGREVEMWLGPRGGQFSGYRRVFRGTAAGWGSWTKAQSVLSLFDRQLAFARPLQSRLYGGTGGSDGTADMANQPIPVLYGERPSLEPVLVDPPFRVYQFNDGAALAVDALRDRGVALISAGDVATLSLASVYDWTPVAGKYVTDLARGLVRLGADPIGKVTMTARGWVGPDGYAGTTAAIIRLIATTRVAGLSIADPEGIDVAAFAAVEAAQPAPVGIYIAGARPNVDAVLDELAGGIGAVWGLTPLGLLTLLIFGVPPATEIAVSEDDIHGGLEAIERSPAGAPVWRVEVEWGRNDAPQSDAELSDTLSLEARAFYKTPRRFASAADLTVRTRHRFAEEMQVAALFVSQEDAATEAERLQALYGVERHVYRAPYQGRPFTLRLGMGVELDLTGEAGSRLDLPKTVVLVGLTENPSDKQVGTEFWG